MGVKPRSEGREDEGYRREEAGKAGGEARGVRWRRKNFFFVPFCDILFPLIFLDFL